MSQQQIPTTSLFYQALLETIVNFVVKTRGDIPVAAEMRSVFHQTAPGFALDGFQTMQEAVEKNTFSQKAGVVSCGFFRGARGCDGDRGIIWRVVAAGELSVGVRSAFEWRLVPRGEVWRSSFCDRWSMLIGAGLGVGLVLAFVAGRFIKGFLYHVQQLDVWTYGAVAVTLSVIGLLAALLPARRAASIEPMKRASYGLGFSKMRLKISLAGKFSGTAAS